MNLTGVFQAFIALLAALITAFVIPEIRANTTRAQQEMIREVIRVAVLGAEKYFGSGNGSKKLEMVRAYLTNKGIEIDEEELKMTVDAAIKEMELMEEPQTELIDATVAEE